MRSNVAVMPHLSLKIPARYPPRNPRLAVSIEAALYLRGDEAATMSIRNISAEGAMGWCEAAVEPGEWVGVEIPGVGVIPANVRWCERGEIGLRFRRPLDLERLAGPDPAA